MTATCEKNLIICNKRGLHARAAARFVETACRFSSAIQVSKDNLTVSGRSIMGLLLLAAAKGETISVKTEGDDSAQAMEALTALVNDRFKEKD